MSLLRIDFDFPDWVTEVKSREAELNMFIAAQVQTNRGLLFDAEGNRPGHERWPTLKFRAGQILSNRGALRKSIAPFNPRGIAGPNGVVQFTESMIIVGTRLLYARMMNDGTTKMPGGVLRPKNAKALRIPLPKGENATQTAKDLRATGTKQTDINGALQQRLARANARFAKASAYASEAGTIQAAEKLRRAQVSLARVRATVGRKVSARQRIRSTGVGGRGFIFVNSVRIPARPFDQWTQADQDEIDESLKNKLTEILNSH